jgi:hypothetical protein
MGTFTRSRAANARVRAFTRPSFHSAGTTKLRTSRAPLPAPIAQSFFSVKLRLLDVREGRDCSVLAATTSQERIVSAELQAAAAAARSEQVAGQLLTVSGQLRNTRFTPHSLAALTNQGSERQNAPQNLQASGSIALTMVHELLRLLHVGVRQRQRCLKYAQRLASKLQSSMQIADLEIVDANIQTCDTYLRMVLRQHTLLKLKRLHSHHQSFLMPPKIRARVRKIADFDACSGECQPLPQLIHHKIKLHLCPDGSLAAHAVETQASSLS